METPVPDPDQPEPTLSEDLEATMDTGAPEDQTPPETPETPKTPETTPAEPDEPNEGASGPDSFLDFVRERYGADLASKYPDDLTAVEGLVNAHRKLSERDEDAAYGREMRQYEQDFQQYLAWRQQQQAQAQPPSQPGTQEKPEFDPNWRYMVTRDEQGNLVPVPGAPADVVQKLQRAQEYIQTRIQDLIFNQEPVPPEHVIAQAQQAAQQVAMSTIQQQIAEQQAHSEMQQFATENREWLFVDGDPNKGPTAALRQLEGVWPQFAPGIQNGQYTPRQAIELAMNVVRGMQPAPQTVEPKPQAKHKPGVAKPPAPGPDDEIPEGETLEESLLRTLIAP